MTTTRVFALFTAPLERERFRYAITGSVAGIAYGEPRMTNDIDVVVDVVEADAARLCGAFPLTDFYCPPEEVVAIEARRLQRGHFNVIHHDTGFKADIYPKGGDPLQAWALDEAQALDADGMRLSFAPPEYVIVKKLEYFREGGSQKHIDDIDGILRNLGGAAGGLDVARVERHVHALGLGEAWARCKRTP